MERINELAVRLDKVARDLDPYDYRDVDGSVEQVLEGLKDDPIGVIEYLVDMLEEYTA